MSMRAIEGSLLTRPSCGRRSPTDRTGLPSRAAASGTAADRHSASVRAEPAAPRLSRTRAAARSRKTTRRWLRTFDPAASSEIGTDGGGFAFDCERPRHRVLLQPYALADRLVTNARMDGFHRRRRLPQSAAVAFRRAGRRCRREGLERAALLGAADGDSGAMTLRGVQPRRSRAPVAHVSYFEADAFAPGRKRRLPTEFEWEHAAAAEPLAGNFVEAGPPASGARQRRRPVCVSSYGDVWEWTRSAFAPYPRFRPAEGAVGEYNGKFMCGQFVLRGGSCVTPTSHMRRDLPQFLSARRPMAILGRCGWREMLDDARSRRICKRGQHEAFRADVLAGLVAAAKIASLPLALRRARLGSVRGDHPARRILSHPRPRRRFFGAMPRTWRLSAARGVVLLEYGAGRGDQDRNPASTPCATPRIYVPIDIAADLLSQTAARIAGRFLDLDVFPMLADFTGDFDFQPTLPAGRRVGFFPGSTIGNLNRREAVAFLSRMRRMCGARRRDHRRRPEEGPRDAARRLR